MKIHHPVGLLLVLATPVAAQVGAMEAPAPSVCSTIGDCPAGTYCNSVSNECLQFGACVEPADCGDPTNSPYAINMCLGTVICDQGLCGMDCGVFPEDSCQSHTDCLDGEFCAADGVCERMGGCAVVEDCFLDENVGYPIAACMGSMECNNRKCGMKCTGSDALFPCDTSDECRNGYCNMFGHCSDHGTCVEAEDCDNAENSFMEVACEGPRVCTDGMCGKECTGAAPQETLPVVCEDCPANTYCAGNGECLAFGACDIVADCTAPGNDIAFPACLGTISCDNGSCGKQCEEDTPAGCVTNDDCPVVGSYCAGNGECIKNGYCGVVEDCTADGNDYPIISCVGTLSCNEGQCDKTCDGSDPVSTDVQNPVELEVITCATDADCTSITTATTRSATEQMYCAQGVCTKHGSCFSDEDCMNPANIIWNDKRCMGYLHCTEEGLCDRECGVMCKNGSQAANCFEDVCATFDECDGAVGCVLDSCDNECKPMLFDAAGKVLPDCAVAADTDLVSPEPGNFDSDTDISRLESSAVRATSIFTILAVVLVATIA